MIGALFDVRKICAVRAQEHVPNLHHETKNVDDCRSKLDPERRYGVNTGIRGAKAVRHGKQRATCV